MLNLRPRGLGLAMPLLALTIAIPAAADAQQNTYDITPAEKAACQADATRLCSDAWPDEGRLLSCMSTHQASLGANCHRVFDAGMKRRGLAVRGAAKASTPASHDVAGAGLVR